MGTNHEGVNFGRRLPPTGGQFSTLNNRQRRDRAPRAPRGKRPRAVPAPPPRNGSPAPSAGSARGRNSAERRAGLPASRRRSAPDGRSWAGCALNCFAETRLLRRRRFESRGGIERRCATRRSPSTKGGPECPGPHSPFRFLGTASLRSSHRRLASEQPEVAVVPAPAAAPSKPSPTPRAAAHHGLRPLRHFILFTSRRR